MYDLLFKRQWNFLFGRFATSNLQSYDMGDPIKKIDVPEIIKVTEPCSLEFQTIQTEPMDIPYMFSPVVALDVDADSVSQHRKNSIASMKGSPSCIRRYAGVLLALLATFVYSLGSVILKVFSNYHPFTVSIWRFQGMILPSVPILLYHVYVEKKPVFNTVWPLTKRENLKNVMYISARSLLGCTSSVLQIYALHYLPIADCSVIVFSSPVFVLFVAHIFLGEKAGYFSIVMAILTLIGVGIIARPSILTGTPMDTDTLLGIGFAFGSMLGATLVFVILRHLRDVHYAVVTMGYGIEGTLECAILALACGVFELPHSALEWGLMVALVLITWGGQTSLILALQFEQAGVVSLINSTDTIFAFILQFIFLNLVPDMYSLIGSGVVIIGVLLSTFRKWVSTLPEKNPSRQRFGFMLK